MSYVLINVFGYFQCNTVFFFTDTDGVQQLRLTDYSFIFRLLTRCTTNTSKTESTIALFVMLSCSLLMTNSTVHVVGQRLLNQKELLKKRIKVMELIEQRLFAIVVALI